MAKITVCDYRDDKGNPCGERADVLVSLVWDGKKYEVDLCSQLHAKALTANAREASSPAPTGKVTKLPTAGPKFSRSPEFNEWAASKGYTIAPKGKIKQTIIDEWEASKQ